MMLDLNLLLAKQNCFNLINSEDFLWYDKQDSDTKIQRCQEHWTIFEWLCTIGQYILAEKFGKLADSGEYDHKYYDNEWEIWHCNY